MSAAVGVVAVVAGALLLVAAPASASVTIKSFNAIPSTTQAGAHPDFSVEFELTSRQGEPTPCACNDAKDVNVHLPPGLIGNPHATPQCGIAEFASDLCPPDSQLGVAEVGVGLHPGEGGTGYFITPVYNLIPPPEQPALLAFKSSAFDSPTFEDVSARTDGDYGLDVKAVSIEHFFPLTKFRQVTWGTPAAPVHDYLRFGFGQSPILYASIGDAVTSEFCDQNGQPASTDPATIYQLCTLGAIGSGHPGAVGEISPYRSIGKAGPGHPVSSNSPLVPFLQNPTTCGLSSLLSTIDVLAYDRGETHAQSPWPSTTACDRLAFNPSQAIAPTTEAADSPSGAEFRLTVPQFESSSVPSPSELNAADVTLPAGFSLAPNVTNGKATCSEAQAMMGAYASTEEGHCPEDAKIGTISVDTPVLPGPLFGAAYLGEPRPGNRFRMFLVFDGFGVHVKLPGTITPDPLTGQIHIAFRNLPQAPFETFNLHVFGSERGPLDTPTQCGNYEVTSVFTPWDSALVPVTSRQFFNVTEGPGATACPDGPRPFHPTLQAASTASSAAAHTHFWLSMSRADGEQNLKGLKVTTPPGFAATLKGLSYCPDAAIAAAQLETHTGLQEQISSSCPASSHVGELIAAAGPGPHPLYLPGKVYLAGSYQGAPLSFVFITPAVSGGYDLGNVGVREALHINPETAQVTAGGAQLPQIFGGIPLRLRQIFINLNRPSFALNPTNCNPLEVKAELFGSEGTVSDASQHFQVANCASLPFAPKLSLKLTGGVHRRGHPAIHTLLTAKPGEANSASVSLALPPGELLDNAHIQSPCTRGQLGAGHCPPGSVLGHARAITPLLDQPLEGPVYLTTGFGHKLPDLVADLNGQIHIQLDGMVDTANGGSLRTTFQSVPDAPITTFTLDLLGGSKGLVQNSASLCGARKQAALRMVGQNGKRLSRQVPLQAACGKAAKHKRRKRHRADTDQRAAR